MATTLEKGNKGGRASTSCGECQRRKQKCNREWPCNHCHARKVPNLCHFTIKKLNTESPINPDEAAKSPGLPRKRKSDDSQDEETQPVTLDIDDVDATLQEMGFGNGEDHFKYGWNLVEKTVVNSIEDPQDQQVQQTARQSDDIEAALSVVLPRPYTDALVQYFLGGGNYYYYIIFPGLFSDQYKKWWDDKTKGTPLTAELTCLILRVCACAAQFLAQNLREQFENDLGLTSNALSHRFHEAAQKLGATIGPGKGGLAQIQQIFMMSFWLKSEARWVESWHALGAAIREAQEMGLHQDSRSKAMTEFDREMGRRTWCLLYTWDWQISHLFGRPLMINHKNCSFELPKLKLDQTPPTDPDAPSPFYHMLLQCELIRGISQKFGVLELPLSQETALALQQDIQDWIDVFPPIYAVENTDTSKDAEYPWLLLQRPYLHAVSFAMMLIPLKSYVIKPLDANASTEEKELRSHGIDVCLKFMDMSKALFDQVYPNDGKFHVSFFGLFDGSALLCSALLHDDHKTLPRQDEIIDYIARALGMLKHLQELTVTASTAYRVLRRLVSRLDLTPEQRQTLGFPISGKRIKKIAVYKSPSTEGMSPESTLSGDASSLSLALSPALMTPPPSDTPPIMAKAELGLEVPSMDAVPPLDANGFHDPADISQVLDIGDFGYIWDWNAIGVDGIAASPPLQLP